MDFLTFTVEVSNHRQTSRLLTRRKCELDSVKSVGKQSLKNVLKLLHNIFGLPWHLFATVPVEPIRCEIISSPFDLL